MPVSWSALGLSSPLGVGSLIGWGAALGALAFLGLRAGKERLTRGRLEAQVEALTKELEKAKRTLHEALTALENENFMDPLTELHNRRYIRAVIRADVAKVQRVYRDAGPGVLENQDLVFFMVDLDHFSQLNEFFGQSTGDLVLVAVAQALRKCFRESDAVIRWGGEEFLVVARNTSRGKASELAERARSAIAGLSRESPKGETLRWTCSVGFAPFPFQTEDTTWLGWERVIELTEACVEVAKKSGRNAWVGLRAKDGLDRTRHGARFPKGLRQLVDEGVLEVLSSREDPFGKSQKIGEILG